MKWFDKTISLSRSAGAMLKTIAKARKGSLVANSYDTISVPLWQFLQLQLVVLALHVC